MWQPGGTESQIWTWGVSKNLFQFKLFSPWKISWVTRAQTKKAGSRVNRRNLGSIWPLGFPHLPGVQSCKNFKGNLIHVLLPVCNSSSRLCVNRTSLWLEAIFFFFYFSLSLPPLFFLFKRMPFLSSTESWLGPKTNRVVAESSQGQLGASQHSLSRFLTSNLLPVLSSSLAGSQ